MDLIVLVKYVADVDNIPEDAWDTERGTLRRNRLQMVANPLDDRALQLGLAIRDKVAAEARGTTGRLIVLSMGPPQAEEICRRAIAHGADGAVLLSDGAFSGADTIATARTIAGAVRKMVAQGMVQDPLVLAGMQSPDGDTAQVPVQVAALLQFPLIPYVAEWRMEGHVLSFETLQPRGRSELTLQSPPALATVTKYIRDLPFFTSLVRMGVAADAILTKWNRDDLGLQEANVGLAGSYTRVVQIFSPEKRGRAAYRLDFGGEQDPLEALPVVLGALRDFLHTGGESDANTAEDSGATSSGSSSYYKGECAVLCERETSFETGPVSAGSRELLGAARGLAESLGTTTTAIIPGVVLSEELEELARSGAECVVSIQAEFTNAFLPEEQANAVTALVRERNPQILLVPATLTGRVVAPLVAAELGAGLTADCTGLQVADFVGRVGGKETVYGKVLHQTRPALGGNVMATIVSLRGRDNRSPQMATARSGVFTPVMCQDAVATLETFVYQKPSCDDVDTGDENAIDRSRGRVVPSQRDVNAGPVLIQSQPEKTNLDECDVIVSVGLGIGSRENVERLARPLVRALEKAWGVTVGLGCSRAAMEAGYLPYAAQVGQTGRTVKPRVYIALGISGAVQHRVGMENAGRILSINSDDEAPLLSHSDYVIRASCQDAVPVLIKLLDEGA